MYYYYLEKVYQLLHARLVAGRPEDVLLVRGLLVQLQDHHQQRPGNVIVGALADALQRNAKFDSVRERK